MNERAVARARELIEARQYVVRSEWGEVQPRAADQDAFLESHSWDEYGDWHLGLTEGASEGTKARFAFVYGDFRRVHRMGLIACHYRAAEWEHKEIELAAHDLLQLLDRKSLKLRGDRRPTSRSRFATGSRTCQVEMSGPAIRYRTVSEARGFRALRGAVLNRWPRAASRVFVTFVF